MFALVTKLNTTRVLLFIAVNFEWLLFQLDVKNTFLNGELEEKVYMDAPSGFEYKFIRKEDSRRQSDRTMFMKYIDKERLLP